MCPPKLLEEVLGIKITEKEAKASPTIFQCKECGFAGKTINGLSTHVRMTHKKVKANAVKTKHPENNHFITVEEFAEKYEMIEEVSGGNNYDKNQASIPEKETDEDAAEDSPEEENMIDPILALESQKTDEEEEEAKDGKDEKKMSNDEEKSNMVGKKVKRKQPKVRRNDFACKHCDLKFGKVNNINITNGCQCLGRT
jgi:hypothetical protein